MSQYTTGTVNVTNGSPTVTLVGGTAISQIAQGNWFSVVDPVLNGAGTQYTVAADPVSDEEFSISPAWQGTSATGRSFAVHRDFTAGGSPIWNPGDQNVPAIFNKFVQLIENGMIGGGGGGGVTLPSFIGKAFRVLRVLSTETGTFWSDHRFVPDALSEIAPTSIASRLAHYSMLSGAVSLGTDGVRASQWNDISGAAAHATANTIGPIVVGTPGRASYGLRFNNIVATEEIKMISTVTANATTMFLFVIARCDPSHEGTRNLLKTAHSGAVDTQTAGDIELRPASSGDVINLVVSTSAAAGQVINLGAFKNGLPFAVAIGLSNGTVLGWGAGQGQTPAQISTTYQHGAGFDTNRIRFGTTVDSVTSHTLHEVMLASVQPTEEVMQRLILWAKSNYFESQIAADETNPQFHAPVRLNSWPLIGSHRGVITVDGPNIVEFFGPARAMTTPNACNASATWSRSLFRSTSASEFTLTLLNTVKPGFEIEIEQKTGTAGFITLVLESGAINETGFGLVVDPGRLLSLKVVENATGTSAAYSHVILPGTGLLASQDTIIGTQTGETEGVLGIDDDGLVIRLDSITGGGLTNAYVTSATFDLPTQGTAAFYSTSGGCTVILGASFGPGGGAQGLLVKKGGGTHRVVVDTGFTINGSSATHSSGTVADAVWGTVTGNSLTITSAGGNLADRSPGNIVVVRNHSNAANNGFYIVEAASHSTTSMAVTKLSSTPPVAAASESVDIDHKRTITLAGAAAVVLDTANFLVGPGGTDEAKNFDASLLQNGTLSTGMVVPVELMVALGDETTNLTTGTAKVTLRMPYAMTLTAVRASVNTAPAGSTIIVDINEAGATILSTKLSIDAAEETSVTAASQAVISDAALADDAELTFDIDQVGSSTPGKGLKVTMIGTRTLA